ncbi:MAG: DUF3368 domain-containing protein [Candidatus Methanoperedens sp.]|nr:DUF3368 domain-containing protein [Candidatus Methanoperedens sp.]
MGCLGLLKMAKKRELIKSVGEVIKEMKNESFYVDEGLITALLESVGEK